MKKILVFAHNIRAVQNPNGYRIEQYFPYLERTGFAVRRLTTRTGVGTLVSALREADVVYVQRLLPDIGKRYLLKSFAKKIVFDFDDAIMYGTRRESRTRRGRFRSMIRLSHAVLCGNDFLVSEAKRYKEENVFCVPTVVDTDDYPVKEHVSAVPFAVGWMGGAATLRYLQDVSPLLIAPPAGAVFKVVADKRPDIAGAQVAFEKWSGETEKRMLLGFDAGIMPARNDVWSRGKCGLKLIQYAACGLPSISHPFGVSNEIIEDGVSGFLRAGIDGWREAIERLRDDAALRKRMGMRARAIAEERYSLKCWGPRVAGIVGSL
jgi:glycosyltransferase involved in cell wall biosynthesis